MYKKARIVIKLSSEASKLSVTQIEERIRNKAKIPCCNAIEEIAIVDIEGSYKKLKEQGISENVAQNIIDLYTE